MSATINPWLCRILVTAFVASSTYPAKSAQLVSVSGPGFQAKLGGSGDSGLSLMSRDGRYVLFASTANNLTLTNNNNFVLPCRFNVFLRDNLAQTTTLVSVNRSGNGGGNGDSFPTGLSTNGQFALFESTASDLVPNDTNNAADVFVRDVINGTTTLVSVGLNGGISSSNGVSRSSVMTPDGRYVAFVSTATNLVAGDTNNIADVFVRDLQAGATKLASVGAVNSSNAPPAVSTASSSESPEITPDGRYVAFYSSATNLVSGITSIGEVYVRDLVAGNTLWASTNARAIFQAVLGSANIVSCNYSISEDGQFVAFEVCSNIPGGPFGRGIILRYGLQTGLTDTLTTNASVPQLTFPQIHDLAMSPDGRFVAFLTNGFPANAIYCWDAQTGTNTLVSANLANSGPAGGSCDSPVISPDGRFVAFTSSGTNLVANTLVGPCHVYLRDLLAGATQLIDADTNGIGVGVDSTVVPALSADGSVVVFDCANLLPDNRHLVHDVFMRTVTAGTTALISASSPALSSSTPDGITGFTTSCLSTNGRFVAFYSDADNLVPNDTNGCRDVFVRDQIAGLNLLVSVNTNGNASGDGISTDPAISADGRYVAFTSGADNLVVVDTNRSQDVFVRDLVAGTTALVSVSTDGVDSGNGDSFSPSISADGRYVLFHSKASNLAAGSFGSGIENLFCRDLLAGTTYALTAANLGVGVYSAAMTPDGQSVAFIGTAPGISGTQLYVWNPPSAARTHTNSVTIGSGTFPVVAISANGQKLAYLAGSPLSLYAADVAANTVVTVNNNGTFLSHAGLRFSNDGRFLICATTASASATNQSVYLYDLQAGTNLLVSQNFSSPATNNAGSDSPSISPDGRFIAYRSFASNLVAMDSNTVADLYLYDAVSNATYLVSLNASGISAAADRSLKPVFSGDSQTLFFQSWASDLSGNDYNNGSDLFAVNLALPLPGSGGGGSGGYPSGFYVQLIPAGAAGPNPVVSWSLAAGEAYQVQFKTNLTDVVWLNLPGNAAFIGLTGYLSDLSPAPGQRFYRILSNP
ncbi:MAG: hypothetical protein WAO02_09835 [Verrucomicrobiia bacterium]